MLLGGRAAEEIALGRVSTGAQNDLYQATQLARRMVRDFGMSEKLGPLTFIDGDSPLSVGIEPSLWGKQYSEETARIIDAEVRDIVERNYRRVKALLAENKDILLEFAGELEQRETIQGAELREKIAARTKAGLDAGQAKPA